MEKAFEIKGLIEKLKVKGLDVAEDALKIFIVEFGDWAMESIDLTPTKLDDFVKPAIPVLVKWSVGKVDKIDGVIEEPV